jgi:hypothetical protein
MFGFEVGNILSVVKVAVLESLLLDKNFRGEEIERTTNSTVFHCT